MKKIISTLCLIIGCMQIQASAPLVKAALTQRIIIMARQHTTPRNVHKTLVHPLQRSTTDFWTTLRKQQARSSNLNVLTYFGLPTISLASLLVGYYS